jgi:hypothetical protein
VILEHVHYTCPVCQERGQISELLLRPSEFIIIRGECKPCRHKGQYKIMDTQKLAREHAAEEAEYAALERAGIGLIPVH